MRNRTETKVDQWARRHQRMVNQGCRATTPPVWVLPGPLPTGVIRTTSNVCSGSFFLGGHWVDTYANTGCEAQRISQAVKNTVARGESAATGFLGGGAYVCTGAEVGRFDQLGNTLRTTCPSVDEEPV